MPTQAVRCERAVRVIGPDDTVCQEPRRHLGIRQSCGNNPVLKLGGRPGLNPAKPQVFPHQPSVTAIRPLRRTRWERSIMADLSDQKTAQHPPARSRFDREAERDVEKNFKELPRANLFYAGTPFNRRCSRGARTQCVRNASADQSCSMGAPIHPIPEPTYGTHQPIKHKARPQKSGRLVHASCVQGQLVLKSKPHEVGNHRPFPQGRNRNQASGQGS